MRSNVLSTLKKWLTTLYHDNVGGVPATPIDPRASFNFSIEIDGLEVALCESATIPEASIGVIKHSGAGAVHSTQTGGRLTFGEVQLEKVMASDTSDKWAWNWMKTVRDAETGLGQPASVYKKTISIIHYGPQNQVIDKWDIVGCFPTKIAYSKNDAGQDNERMLESVTLTPDRYNRP